MPQVTATGVADGGCTLNAAFVADLTIPDGTVLNPKAAFVKTWRVKNSGTCDWTAGTQLVFADGDQMSGPVAVAVPATGAGGTADISVNLITPAAPGNYSGRWRLRSPDGTVFGGLTVVIVVPGTPTATPSPTPTATPTGLAELYNLHDSAGSASWSATSGDLTFPGTAGDNKGFAMFQDGQKLEDGNTYNRILETQPTQITGGFIKGVFTVGTIKPGDRFRTRIGFLADAAATQGNVNFVIQGGNGVTVGSFGKKRDGSIITIDLDLTPIAGQTNQIVLRVDATNTDAAQDSACWVNPRVVGTR